MIGIIDNVCTDRSYVLMLYINRSIEGFEGKEEKDGDVGLGEIDLY